MFFIYFFLFIFAFIVLAALGLIGGIFRLLFGSKRKNPGGNPYQKSGGNAGGSTHWYTYNRKKKKVFSDTEGEYIDFEEIKEDKPES